VNVKKIALCLCFCLCFALLAGCAKPPAYIKRSGRKPVNDLRYYPYLTEAEKTKFTKLRAKELQPPENPLDLPEEDGLYGPKGEYDYN